MVMRGTISPKIIVQFLDIPSSLKRNYVACPSPSLVQSPNVFMSMPSHSTSNKECDIEMNVAEQIKWWERFCNSCCNENCKSCKTPEIMPSSRIDEFDVFFSETPFESFFRNEHIISPSNYVHVYVRLGDINEY